MRLKLSILRYQRNKTLVFLNVLVILLVICWLQQGYRELHKSVTYMSSTIIQGIKKINWHNYPQIYRERLQVGDGEQGKPVLLPNAKIDKEAYSDFGYNGVVSDMIQLNRSLPDIRHPSCKDRMYVESLPSVSVVVPFYNEHWSTLLRTIYSVLNRSPEHLIKEILLVDDASTKEFLKEKLYRYAQKHMPKVKIIRILKRVGPIKGRLVGAQKATAEVLVFMDAHTEVNVNWLPPLLEPIAVNNHIVVCPYVDVIAHDTFEYRKLDGGARGVFDWELNYKRLSPLPRDVANMPEPFESPVMEGRAFAISKAFFWELGGYDTGLSFWGGEQYELSFKIWLCGGWIVDAPCSHVGHVYRQSPRPYPGDSKNILAKNYRRVAEVWMDQYAKLVYSRRPDFLDVNPGNLTKWKAIREKLQCRPFNWFMAQVAFDLDQRYPVIEPFGEGEIWPVSTPELCLDAHRGAEMERITLRLCNNNDEQKFVLSRQKDVRLRNREMCWEVPESRGRRRTVLLSQCHFDGGNQKWRYLHKKKMFKHASGTCLDFSKIDLEVFVSDCDEFSMTQAWSVEILNVAAMAQESEEITGPIPKPEYFEIDNLIWMASLSYVLVLLIGTGVIIIPLKFKRKLVFFSTKVNGKRGVVGPTSSSHFICRHRF